MKIKALLFQIVAALLWFALAASVRKAEGASAWTNFYSGPAHYDDHAYAIALDANDNAYVTGLSYGIGTGYDYATIKYSSNGIAVWTNRFNGAGNNSDSAQAIGTDSSGNVFVTGQSYNSQGNIGFATIKYSSTGTGMWTNLYNGDGGSGDFGEMLAIDNGGNIYATGSSGHLNSLGSITIKYSNAGLPLWTNRFVGSGSAACSATDAGGNFFLAGQSGSFSGVNSSPGYATVKFSPGGIGLWTNFFRGTGNSGDFIKSMAIDSSSNVIVTGSSWSRNYYYDFDYVTIKYSGAGVALWTNQYNGPTDGDDKASSVAVDTNGNVYVTGVSSDRYSQSLKCVTIKYSDSGIGLWTNYYGPATMLANSLGVDGSGNVYVPASPFGGPNGGYNFAIIKYSNSGMALWTNIFNGPGNSDDLLAKLVLDISGDVFVTGSTLSNSNGYNYATIKLLGNPPLPITLTGQILSGNKLRLSAVGQAGTNYVLERNYNLKSTNWIPQSTNPAALGGVLIFTNTPTSNTNNFWRIRSLL